MSKIRKAPESIEDFGVRSLGAIFRRERERRRFTQLEIAKRIGKSKIAVGFYERGLRPIHFGTFVKLCSAIRISPGFVIDQWMRSEVFDVLDEERRKEYHKVLDDAIKYGFSLEIDSVFLWFRGLIEQEKERRKREASRKKIQEYIGKREDQGDDGI